METEDWGFKVILNDTTGGASLVAVKQQTKQTKGGREGRTGRNEGKGRQRCGAAGYCKVVHSDDSSQSRVLACTHRYAGVRD